MSSSSRWGVAVASAAAVLLVMTAGPASASSVDWPSRGQAAYVVGDGTVVATGHQHAVPIASVAKVMTAYLVLRAFPLRPNTDGFRLVVTARDADDTARRRADDESTVPVRAGERLSERQALAALLLPSANNIAIMLARRVAGSVSAFVRRMNATAASLHLTHTRYTDPSGLDAGTRSTALDQLTLVRRVLAVRAFAYLVGRTSAVVPVAGRVHNTDTLLGHDGFVGVKTGSDDAAGGCLSFRSVHQRDGRPFVVTGVVLGQRGDDLITAALRAARRLVDSVVRRGH